MRINFKIMYSRSINFLTLSYFFIFAIVMVVAAIVGGVLHFSSVPYMDMYNGVLGFYSDISEGKIQAWWNPHNEHRIILSRLLFWLDIAVFGGGSHFLYIVNYLLLGLSAFVFYFYYKALSRNKQSSKFYIVFLYFIFGWIFSWVQVENITWAFQSQFFLAQLVPLGAFYFLALSVESKTRKYFILACIFGVLSIGTMANGILTLPLMAVFGLLFNFSSKQRLILFALAFLGPAIYFYGYPATNPSHELSVNIFQNLHYVLYYIGSAFFKPLLLFGFSTSLVKLFVTVLSFSLILFCGVYFIWQLISKSRDPIIMSLLFFLLFIGGTAFVTSLGRSAFGLDQALSSRYTTPSLFAFLTLFILVLNFLRQSEMNRLKGFFVAFLAVLSMTMLFYQLSAVRPTPNKLHVKDAAVLALSLEIPHDSTVKNVFPFISYAMHISQKSKDSSFGFFSNDPYVELKQNINQKLEDDRPVSGKCVGHLDKIEVLGDASEYAFIKGWIYNPEDKNTSKWMYLIDNINEIKGYIVTGEFRPDVESAIAKEAAFSGFSGYIRREAIGRHFTARDFSARCSLDFASEERVFLYQSVKVDELALTQSYANVIDIISNNGWTGTDYDRSTLDGFKVFGSYRQSDADTGRIELKINKGSKLLIRTGPVTARQKIRIKGTAYERVLNPAKDWTILSFPENKSLPDELEVEISDLGDGWGEWSAVALVDG